MDAIPDPKLFISGQQVAATSGFRFENRYPATSEILGHVEEASLDDVDQAVKSARAGFRQWSGITGAQRGRVLRRTAELIQQHAEELARLEVSDTGKPISEALAYDIPSCAEVLEYFGTQAGALEGAFSDLGTLRPETAFYTRREPLGVCAGIGAWNYPLQIACWKSAPALACGNSMIFKPAELTPMSAIRLAELYCEAGLPEGVFNVVQGGPSVGQMLSRHEGIAKVSLTGEVETGKTVVADAASTLKHVTMELGGKSPLIIFADAPLENAVSGAIAANFYCQGEVCTNGTRVFVEETVHEAFLARLFERLERVVIGDPMERATHMGALISAEHRERVQRFVDKGRQEGARLHEFGLLPDRLPLRNGYFVRPCVFDRCTDEMTIVRQEIFGPVMSVLSFRSEEEVIARANATPYGLAGGVFTGDLRRAHRVASQLEAGICWINSYNVTPAEMPFGGVKQSGFGRENGRAALDHYSALKSVYIQFTDVETPF